ncbi:HD-GYP domain-containing protein [Marinobacter sp. SS21]|uniref:HD-GYP domain-containing protein n=1 Tax=Marinobacter sp. SS21 TaxID=2979460 RepID=UPI002330E9E8|nr:HD-GYP domain-containing protein [Marinobacter sp. SS21]MDC0663270.1 DUF3391 domain-containing protein [Marinobacter sp. SS21]
MGVSQKKVAAHSLQVGMFVSDLDRPWHQTPFPIQGFRIRSDDDVKSVASYCSWVMIDVPEKRSADVFDQGSVPIFQRRRPASPGGSQEVVQLPPIQIKSPVAYPETAAFRKELRASEKLVQATDEALRQVLDRVRAGEIPDLRSLASAAQSMATSVTRNPDALLWLSRMQHYDDYLHQHGVNTAVWGLVFGRFLGLEKGLLNHLALGCLLAQVGKVDLPATLLRDEDSLSSQEFTEYKSYVVRGLERLQDTGLSRAVTSIIQFHRERHNGSGFPEGLRGDRIPLLAKIAGLMEYYESLISPRDSARAQTPAQAVAYLYETRNIEFQEDLVEKFIQAIGIYPIGTLVELSDGQRGVVVSHSPERRLLPKVMVMTNQEHQSLKQAKIINLARHNAELSAESSLLVKGCLPRGTDGLDPGRFDVTGAESRWRFGKLLGG